MKFFISISLAFFLPNRPFAQNSFSKIKDSVSITLLDQKTKQERVTLIGAVNVAAYVGTMTALYQTWYKNYPQSKFHFFNDNKEWLQVDKVGHMWSAYTEGRVSIEMWTWAGLPRKKAIWIGGLSGLAYQSIIEVLDGFSAEWGFSWGDYTANVIGSGMLVAQELGWKEQKIQLKFSSHYQSYGNNILNTRADDIYGTNLPERILKDYNAQTYWLSANIRAFFKDAKLPPWLNIAVGYGAEGMFGAVDNIWTGKNGVTYDYSRVKRYRQWYIAPDIDFTKIRTKNKLLKTIYFILNSFKFPTPSLEFSNKKVKWNWLHF